jgi:urease accessory protein
LHLCVERRGAVSVVARSRSTLPLQVLAPVALDDPGAVVSILNPTGGLVGGDRLDVEVDVGPDAHACLTTPSATKVYRTTGVAAEQHVRIVVGAGATCEWVPDHTIPFPGSKLRQTLEAQLAADARLIVVDAFAAGRVARGETWRFDHLESALTIRDAAGWLVHDRFVLRGGGHYDALGLTDSRPYFATVIVVADGPAAEFANAATTAGDAAGATVAAAPLPRRGAVVRVLAAGAPAFVAALDAVWAMARQRFLDAPALALRKP